MQNFEGGTCARVHTSFEFDDPFPQPKGAYRTKQDVIEARGDERNQQICHILFVRAVEHKYSLAWHALSVHVRQVGGMHDFDARAFVGRLERGGGRLVITREGRWE